MIITEPHKSWVEFAQEGPKRRLSSLTNGEAHIGYLYYPLPDISPYEVALILRYGRDIEAGYAHPSLFEIVGRHYVGMEIHSKKEEEPQVEIKRSPSKKKKQKAVEEATDGV
jgi:hypothetical protein